MKIYIFIQIIHYTSLVQKVRIYIEYNDWPFFKSSADIFGKILHQPCQPSTQSSFVFLRFLTFPSREQPFKSRRFQIMDEIKGTTIRQLSHFWNDGVYWNTCVRSQKDYIGGTKAPFLCYFPSELQRNSNLKLLKLRCLTRSRIMVFYTILLAIVTLEEFDDYRHFSQVNVSHKFCYRWLVFWCSCITASFPQNSLLSSLLLVILSTFLYDWQISMQMILLISLTADLYTYSNGSMRK